MGTIGLIFGGPIGALAGAAAGAALGGDKKKKKTEDNEKSSKYIGNYTYDSSRCIYCGSIEHTSILCPFKHDPFVKYGDAYFGDEYAREKSYFLEKRAHQLLKDKK